METPPRTPTRTPPRTPGRAFDGGPGFFSANGGATCTPQKTRPRRVHQFFTPQPGTSARSGRLSWDAVGSFADVRAQVGAIRLRDEDEDSVENLRRTFATTGTAIFDPDDCRPAATPPGTVHTYGDTPGTPVQSVSKPASPRNGTLSWGADTSPAMTPAKPSRGHRRVDSTASASSLGAGPKASATPQPNINPFASPGRNVFAASTSRHGQVVAHELAQAAKVATTHADALQQHPQANGHARGGGSVRPRFCFRHYLPWERVDEQPEGGVYVPIHQDANGTVWLGTGMLDGRPYAVKEVPFSSHVDQCAGYSIQDQRSVASDPAVAVEVQALTLCSETAYIQRYFSVHHDPLLRVHVIQAQYCARGTLVEDTLAHHDRCDGRGAGGSPSLSASMASNGGRSVLFAAIPEATIWRILQQVYQGTAVLHRRGIAHNALHPRSVLVDDVGSCKISQFGSATIVASGASVASTQITLALPAEYEPPFGHTAETPFSRDVFSFAKGMLHLIAVSHMQARSAELINDMAAVEIPEPDQLVRWGYSVRLTKIFAGLVEPDPARRPAASAAVTELAPPTPVMASLLELCDSEAARLRARIADLRAQLSERELSPPHRTVSRGQGSDDCGCSPLGNASSTMLGGSLIQADAPSTLARRSRRPTQLILSSSISDMRADGVSPTVARDSVMSPGPLYAIRMHRRHSYAALSFEAANALVDVERAGTATPQASRDSPMAGEGRPFTALSINNASVSRDPRPAGGAHMNNSFDDTPQNESSGRHATRFRFPSSVERVAQPPVDAGTPSRAREDTNIDLFGCASRGTGAATATPPFSSPCAAGGTPALGPGGAARRSSFGVLDFEVRGMRPHASSPRDWTHGVHTETADEALRVLRARLSNLKRQPAPMQDVPRAESSTPYVPPVKPPQTFRMRHRTNSLALAPSGEYDD